MNRRLGFLSAVCLALCCFLTACGQAEPSASSLPTTGTGETVQTTGNGTGQTPADSSFDEYDRNGTPDVSAATTLSFSGTDVSIDGGGASVSDTTVTIDEAGVYVLSGTFSNGQILVCTEDSGIVWLVLDGVNLHCSNSSPIYIKKAERAIVTLLGDSQNTLSDGNSYVFDDAEKEEPNATLFCKSDLTVNGSGSLVVEAAFNNGISSKDGLKIAGGNMQVTSADDAVMGRDFVAIADGTMTLNATGDGIKSTNDTDGSVGFVCVSGGNLTVSAGTDGIQAKSSLTVSGGTLHITTAGGSANAPAKNSGWGQWGMSTDSEDYGSAKGLKCADAVEITGGEITVDSADDAVHANGSVTVSGGTLSLSSGDDGIHADTALTVSGGVIDIQKSYERLESTTVAIGGGEISVVASDDGINCAGGNDGSSLGRPGANGFGGGDGKLSISGGTLRVNAEGDGLDANGSMEMTGGSVVVFGPSNSGNDAFDYDSSFSVSGGTLIAVSNGGMAQPPTDQQQNAVAWGGASIAAGDEIALCDDSGTVLARVQAVRTAQWIYISTPEIRQGTSYTVSAGSSSETVTAQSGLTSIGTLSGGMGGMGGPGGMGGGPGGRGL